MKRKILVALMTMLMVVGLAGCGDDASANQSSVSSETRPTESIVVEESGPEESDAEETEESFAEKEDGAEVEEELDPDFTIQDDSEISGLIIMTATAPLNAGTCEIISFNPENGETKALSSFRFKNSSDVGYLWSDSAVSGYYQFDNTYTRMATRKFLSATGDEHAGWLTADGTFFDVTEAIGAARQSDFADPVRHSSMGFTDNDLFVFAVDNPDDPFSRDYYSVPIANVSAETVQECCTIAYSNFAIESYREYYDFFWSYGTPSSWIDSTHCVLTPRNLSDSSVTSVIFNTEDMTSTDYIPGNSRDNWNGQISPDGSQIAFVSVPRNGNESPDIFIVPISGGEPVRVAKHDFVLAGVKPRFGANTYDSCTMLIDWR